MLWSAAVVSLLDAPQLAALLRTKLVQMSSELPRLFRRVKRQGTDGVTPADFSMIVNDGTVEELNVEAPGDFKVSSAEYMLGQL